MPHCPNCSTELRGAYCSVCGQQGIDPGGHDADSAGSQISAWVQANFIPQTVDGTTVYDLQS